jgi:hypothetical protein
MRACPDCRRLHAPDCFTAWGGRVHRFCLPCRKAHLVKNGMEFSRLDCDCPALVAAAHRARLGDQKGVA